MARVSTTCSHLRHALLGPDSGLLWQWLSFHYAYSGPSTSQPGLDQPRAQGLRALLRRQAHHARSAWVAGAISDMAELESIASALTCVDDLTLHWMRDEPAQHFSAAFAGLPTRLYCDGSVLERSLRPAGIAQLKHVQLCFTDPCGLRAGVQSLASCLPRLEFLRLHVELRGTLPEWRQAEEGLGVLGLLPPASVLQLELAIMHGATATGSLQQLSKSGVQLHTLRLMDCADSFQPADEQLLARCRVCECLVLHFWSSKKRLKLVPAAASVQYQPMPFNEYTF